MRAFSFLFVLTLVSAATLVPSASSAQDREAARAAFQRGVASYEEGQFSVALEAFQDAYRIAPHPSVRVNMANCYEQLDRPVEAVEHFERFLIEATDAPAVQTQEIRASIARLRRTIGEVFLRVEPDGATITIDGRTTLRAPVLDAVKLPQGDHTFEVSMAGFATVTRRLDVDGGERQEVRVTLERGSSADPVTDPGPSDPDPLDTSDPDPVGDPDPDPDPDPVGGTTSSSSGGIPTLVWIGGGVTIALAGTALALGLAASGAESDFEQAVIDSNDSSVSVSERNAARARGLDSADQANRRALAADIIGGLALAAAAGTVVMFFVGGDDDEDDARARVSPTVLRAGGGVSLQGSF